MASSRLRWGTTTTPAWLASCTYGPTAHVLGAHVLGAAWATELARDGCAGGVGAAMDSRRGEGKATFNKLLHPPVEGETKLLDQLLVLKPA